MKSSQTPDSLPSTTTEEGTSPRTRKWFKNLNGRIDNIDQMVIKLQELYNDLLKNISGVSADLLELRYEVKELQNKKRVSVEEQPAKKRIRSDRFVNQILKQLDLPKSALDNSTIRQFIEVNVQEKENLCRQLSENNPTIDLRQMPEIRNFQLREYSEDVEKAIEDFKAALNQE